MPVVEVTVDNDDMSPYDYVFTKADAEAFKNRFGDQDILVSSRIAFPEESGVTKAQVDMFGLTLIPSYE